MKLTGKITTAFLLVIVVVSSVAITKDNDLFFQIKKQLTIFSDVYKEVATQYVDEVGPEKLMRKGIDSMLESLDPYTEFIAEGEQQQLEIFSSGTYGGVGLDAGYRGEDIVVIAPIEGYPAERAGIKPGDIITEINGLDVGGMSPDEVQQLTIGDAGTEIVLVIERRGIDNSIEFVLERERIDVKNINVTAKIGENNQIGYIQLARFGHQTAEEVRQALLSFKNSSNFEGLILDLRNNPGGLLNEAVEIVDKFVEPGVTIVETRGRLDAHNSVLRSDEPALFDDLPLVVLINHGSASASEIVAGALQDLDRAVIVGGKSFGKGLVQTIQPLSYNTSLKITISEYFIPSGRSIQSAEYRELMNNSDNQFQNAFRREFKTKNGRSVYDGMGIEPDILFEDRNESLLNLALKKENKYLFFINDLIGEQEIVQKPDNLFDRFTTFLMEENFTFETNADRYLKLLEENISSFSKESSAQDNIIELKALLRDNKIAQIYENQESIERELNVEWVSQTMSDDERSKTVLQYDEWVTSAIELLGNSYEYQTLLRP